MLLNTDSCYGARGGGERALLEKKHDCIGRARHLDFGRRKRSAGRSECCKRGTVNYSIVQCFLRVVRSVFLNYHPYELLLLQYGFDEYRQWMHLAALSWNCDQRVITHY